jgi:hypothetical protein
MIGNLPEQNYDYLSRVESKVHLNYNLCQYEEKII